MIDHCTLTRRRFRLTVIFNDFSGETLEVVLGPRYSAATVSVSATAMTFNLPEGGTFSFSLANTKHWYIRPIAEETHA